MSAHIGPMTSTLTQYAKAAQALPMAWLTQGEFPAKPLVTSSFQDALDELPPANNYQDNLVRSALQTIVDGVDPRGGTFQTQAVYAAAQLHDRLTSLALEPKVKKPKIREGSVLHGYCGGILDDSYGHRIVVSKGKTWVIYQDMDGAEQGHTGTCNGNLNELVEYLVPDHHCPDNCTLGQD